MNFTSHSLTESEAKEISEWKYQGDYSIYDLPSWDEMTARNFSLCNENGRENMIGFNDESGKFIGYINITPCDDTLFLGIGLSPESCGHGLGKHILQLGLTRCNDIDPSKSITLEVRTWNKRAIKCYESVGFKTIRTVKHKTYAGPGEFYLMEYIHK